MEQKNYSTLIRLPTLCFRTGINVPTIWEQTKQHYINHRH